MRPGEKPGAVPLYHAAMDEFHDLAAHLIDENPEHVNARTEREDATMHAAMNTMRTQSICALLCLSNWSRLGYVRDTMGVPILFPLPLSVLSTFWWLPHFGPAVSPSSSVPSPQDVRGLPMPPRYTAPAGGH